jgi:hypothetical protein
MVREDEYDNVLKNTEYLFFLGDKQFIGCYAESIGYPAWLDQGLILHKVVGYLDVFIDEQRQTMPIVAELYFYRRPQDDAIGCISLTSSLLVHHQIYEDGVMMLFPHISRKGNNCYWDAATQYCFKHWGTEKVVSRKGKLKTLLSDDEF